MDYNITTDLLILGPILAGLILATGILIIKENGDAKQKD